MENIVSKMALLLLTISLAACSSNTQKENTGIGVASGAVIGGLAGSAFGAGTGRAVAVGVGAVAGAIVGGIVGHHMDNSDNQKTNKVMDQNPTNKVTSWHNKQSGARYKVAPTSDKMALSGYDTCRKYHWTETINGKTQHIDGTACREANGTWQPISI